jgi:signal transduction histidine kinase
MRLSSHRTGYGYQTLRLPQAASDPSQLSIIRRLRIDEGPIIINEPIDAIGSASSTLGARISVAGQVLGYLLVESAVHGFYTASHADRLGAIADQAGAAVSNARLAGRASELAAAEERQRLAHELHDAINQTLWTAAITAESLLRDLDETSPLHHRVRRLHQLNRGALSEMRALLLELRPADLTEVSMPELIGFLLTALECRRTLRVDVDVHDVALSPDAHLVYYRIAQEALRNVTHHADASVVSVRLTGGQTVTLTIVDDGRGFDPTNVPRGHLGLAIMHERADSIGAELDVVSAPGSGTTVRLSYRPPRSRP